MAKTRNVPKGSFPVLVYVASNNPLSLSGSMFIHHVPNRKIATITLNVPLLLLGAEGTSGFVLQYDPCNIQHATDSEGALHRTVSLDRLQMKRQPSLHTLSLTLKTPCQLWAPRQRPLKPKPGSEASFAELIQLAKATEVHFVFDRAYLQDVKILETYRLLVHEPDKLTPFETHKQFSSKGLDQYDWQTLAPEDDAPPAYASSRDKRNRPGENPSTCITLNC